MQVRAMPESVLGEDGPAPETRTLVYRSLAELDADVIARWRDLEVHAVHGNAYLSPDFVIPSIRHLTPTLEFHLVVCERRTSDGWQSVALGLFEEREPTRRMPFRHLGTHRCTHAFLTGLLLRADCADLAIELLLTQFLCHHRHSWKALNVMCFPMDLVLSSEQLDHLARKGIVWHHEADEPRAAVRPALLPADVLSSVLSGRTLKNYRRKKRRLAAKGEYRWMLRTGADVDAGAIDRFLALEHTGFRRAERTSLLSDAAHEAFFRDMAARMAAEDKLFFAELSLDGTVIASNCNLRSGRFGFAFKLGWDPAYADYSIGTLNELELLQAMPTRLADLSHMDSGALPGSFMEELWPDLDTLVHGSFTCHRLSHFVSQSIDVVDALRKRLGRSRD